MSRYNRVLSQIHNITQPGKIDLRELSLIYIVLSFGILLDYQQPTHLDELNNMHLNPQDRERVERMLKESEGRNISLQDREESSLA
jgi:hypothetical protein